MEKIIWVIGDDRLEMIEAQRRINAAGSMRALCLLSFEAVQKAALAQEEGERSRISTPSLIIFDYQMAKKEDFASVLFLRKQQSLGGVPLFFMTEKRSEELDEECYEKGATVVVHKPFSRAGIMRIERTAWQHEATKNYEIMLQKQAGDLQEAKEIIRLNKQLQSRNQLLHQIFGRYFSDNVVDSILEDPKGAVIGGEKRKLTVMMADLRGFTAMSESMTPEAVTDILNCFFDEMLQCITKYYGVVIEFLGDAILAVFGASPDSKAQIEEGITAGIKMQKAMAKVNDYIISKGLVPLEMGIGIHRGEVFIGNFGSETMMRYNVIGQAVNECSRIEGASVGGQVLVSYDTVQNANAAIKTDGKFTIQVKGISTPLKVYSVTGIGTPYSCNLAHHKLVGLFWRGRLQCAIQCIEDELVTNQTLRGKIVLLTLDRNLRIELEDKIEPDIPLYSDMEIYLETNRNTDTDTGDGKKPGNDVQATGCDRIYAKILKRSQGVIEVHITYGFEVIKKYTYPMYPYMNTYPWIIS